MSVIQADKLRAFSASLLQAGGFKPQQAIDTATVLVWADARGTASHGVLRIPRYVEMVEQRRINPDAEISVENADGAVAVLNTHNLPGASAMCLGMDKAIEIAEKFRIGLCAVKNISHAGAVGYYSSLASQRSMVGIVMTASIPLMAYHGARVAGLSTNPISIAVPNGSTPIILDMATSSVALGKVLHAKDAGNEIPPNWGIDDRGQPTTIPDEVKTLTPLGGPKGSGLSLMIEILTSVLVANPVISESLKSGKSAMNGLAIAIDISAFTDPEIFADQVDELVSTLKELPKAEGIDQILMPGERGYNLSEQHEKDGIPIATGTVKRLADVASKFDIDLPAEFQTRE